MPHRTRPMAALLLFTGLNVVLVSSITPVYDFVCFNPYWERRRERQRQEHEANLARSSTMSTRIDHKVVSPPEFAKRKSKILKKKKNGKKRAD